jgi:hypothetical protein
MSLTPPTGSKISVTGESGGTVIVIPYGSGGVTRYFVGLFLLFWLGGWFAGFSSAASALWSGKMGFTAAGGFLVFWLGGWTIGGVFAMFYLYRILRPSRPESLRLTPDGVAYDSGVPPFQSDFSGSREKAWQSVFPKRTRLELDRRQLRSLRLRDTDVGNRLTVDGDAVRLEIARSATEIEREWLYQLLAKRYSLPSPSRGEEAR